MIRRVSAALAAVAAVLAGATGASAAERVVIGDGHVDLGPRILDGEWAIRIRDDTVEPPVWRRPADVVLQVRGGARLEIPPGDDFRFLGASGDPVWVLPQVQREGVLWPGWNTQAPEIVDEVAREVTWRLHGVRGPGRFVLFSTQDFGASKSLFSSERPYPQEIGVDVDTHVHGNWAFSAPGTYLLDVEMQAETRRLGGVRARDTLRMFVGDERPERAFAVAAAPSGDSDAAGDDGSAWPLVVGAPLFVLIAALVAATLRRRRDVAPAGER